MNYELAKELKDAGFPHTRMNRAAIRIDEIGGDWISPTLSELIEACGSGFKLLNRQSYATKPDIYFASDATGDKFGKANNPEEAVSRLFIRLQSDKIDSNDKRENKNTKDL